MGITPITAGYIETILMMDEIMLPKIMIAIHDVSTDNKREDGRDIR